MDGEGVTWRRVNGGCIVMMCAFCRSGMVDFTGRMTVDALLSSCAGTVTLSLPRPEQCLSLSAAWYDLSDVQHRQGCVREPAGMVAAGAAGHTDELQQIEAVDL